MQANDLRSQGYEYIPKELWQALKATGLSRRQIADAVNEPINGRFCDRLRGACLSSPELIDRLRNLLSAITRGDFVVASLGSPQCPNDGGFFAHVADDFEPPDPPEPTTARAGSVEKLEIMRLRASQGYAVHHVNDSRLHVPLGGTESTKVIAKALQDEDDEDGWF